MNFILAITKNKTLDQLQNILTDNLHETCAVCRKTHDLIYLAKLIHPDMVIMDLILQGKFPPGEVARYLNEKLDIPVVYILNSSKTSDIREAIKENLHGLITDPGDARQVNYTLELVYNKFAECLYLLLKL